jgi:hypothetical protein
VKFDLLVQALVDAEVDFVLIGGWAAILHGSVTTTRDIDICFSRAPENLRRIVASLAPFQPRLRDLPPELPFLWDPATIANGTTFTLATSAGALDLLAEVDGLGDYEAVKASSKLVHAFDRQLWTLDLKGIIASKRATARPKDLLVLPELESLLESSES